MDGEKPFVTIAIASREDEPRIEACLRAALGQDYPRDRLEVIVADAMSMDATREIILRVAGEDARVRMLDNPDRTRAAALNAIIEAGHGEIVVPMDPGGEYARTHVSKCVDALSAAPVEQLAIVPRTAGRTLTERALSAVQRTRLAFAAGAELAGGLEQAPAILGAVKRKAFARVGLYDPGTRVEEDVELSRRIAETGGALAVRRDIVVHKTEASGFRELFKRHYQLGRSRARTTVKERRVRSLRTLAPFAIVAGGAALGATSSVQPITPFAGAIYALVTGAAAVRVGRTEGIVTIPIAWAAFPVMHVAHGVGFGTGLVRALLKPDWQAHRKLDDEPESA
ncbi:MAG TPA: glycosyltransferase [Labilithrix sp.]|jgi:cellulose synthase/poly-beta-1,6-N-acetylglucosamine synthase-like glycosyltransferase